MSEKCLCCQESEATFIQRQLCNNCYASLRKSDCLDLFPKDHDKLIHHKYSSEVVSAYKELITNNDLTLEDMGKRFGYTRERARQMFELLFGFKYTAIVKQRIASRRQKIATLKLLRRDPRYKVEHYKNINTTYTGKGALAEKKVLDVCDNLSYRVTPYIKDKSIDLVINGFNVEVKSCYKTYLTCPGQKTPSFRFKRRDSQLLADFIVCYAEPINKFFIIPGRDFPSYGNLFIPEKIIMEWKWGKNGTVPQHRKSRWYQYLEAWHLLQPKQPEVVFSRSLAVQSESRVLESTGKIVFRL